MAKYYFLNEEFYISDNFCILLGTQLSLLIFFSSGKINSMITTTGLEMGSQNIILLWIEICFYQPSKNGWPQIFFFLAHGKE